MSVPVTRRSIIAALALATACGSEHAPAPEAAPVSDTPRVDHSDAAHSPPPAVVTNGGVRISLDLPWGEIRAGDLTVIIRADGVSEDVYPRSVDVMSPTMPMHGVTRVPATEASQGTFIATTAIPMSGRWALFVNLDEGGSQTAEFHFDVLPADEGRAAESDSIGGHAP